MAEPTYAYWRAHGSVWHPAQPIAQFASALWPLHGEVGTIGNQAHLTANPPEDHCPFSHTGWPIPNIYPYVCAIDYSGPKWVLTRNWWLYNAFLGFMPWAKYINTGEGMEYTHADGFTHGHKNSDLGHVHMSIRSDWTHKSIGDFHVTAPHLTFGDEGNPVRVAQRLCHTTVDGIFGPATQAAVKNMQRQHGLSQTGLVDDATWLAILPKY